MQQHGDPTAAAAVGAHVRGDWADAERLYKQALNADRSVCQTKYFHRLASPDFEVYQGGLAARPPSPPCTHHPGGNPGANLMYISHRCYLREVAFEWELTNETFNLPLACLQGGPENSHDQNTSHWRAGLD